MEAETEVEVEAEVGVEPQRQILSLKDPWSQSGKRFLEHNLNPGK